MPIQSFRDRRAQIILQGINPGKGFPPDMVRPAERKLRQLNVARRLEDLRAVAGNRLEPLKGDLEGWWSIRINDQFRLIFTWTDAGPADVQITDYH